MNTDKKLNNIKKKTGLLIVPLIISLFTMWGCSSYDNFAQAFLKGEGDKTQDSTIKIGIFQPLSGKDKKFGDLETKGIELAHKLYPQVLGKKVQLVYGDNKSEIQSAQLAAKKLIDKNVDIVLGSYGNLLSMAGGEYFKEANIPAIAITCTNPLLTKGNPFYFRISIVDSFQGVMAAKYVYDEIKPVRVAILKQSDDDYGSALSGEFSDNLEALSAEDEEPIKLITVEYKKDSPDYQSQLNRIKSYGAEVVYLPSSAKDGGEIIGAARELGLNALFIGTDLWREEDFIKEGKEAVNGAIFTTYFDAEQSITEKTNEFLMAYKAQYGEGTPDPAVAMGFDAYLLALHAIEKKGIKSLEESLASVKEFPGATGNITFDKEGDPIKPVMLITIENGEYKHKYTAYPSEIDTTNNI